jgi:predicted ATPase
VLVRLAITCVSLALIDEAQKTAVHLQIGRSLLQNTEPEALSEKIFEIVDHLNLGIGTGTRSEERALPLTLKANDRLALQRFYLNKLILCYLFEEKHQAVQNAVIAEQSLDGVTATLAVALFHFYDSLAHLAVFASASDSEKETIKM